jgi:hypothetical protein
MTQAAIGQFPHEGAVVSGYFEKWSILDRLGCQIGSAFQNWALFIPSSVGRLRMPADTPLVGV